jgi:hypothetical protein
VSTVRISEIQRTRIRKSKKSLERMLREIRPYTKKCRLVRPLSRDRWKFYG